MYCRFLSGMQKSNIFAFNPTLAATCKIIFKWRPGSKLSTMDQHVNFIMIGVQYRLQGVTMYNVQYMYIVQRLASNIDFKVSHTPPICLIRSLRHTIEPFAYNFDAKFKYCLKLGICFDRVYVIYDIAETLGKQVTLFVLTS